METKEEAEENEDNPPLPPWELNHLLEEEEKEGVKDKVDGEAQNLKQSRISDPSRLPPLGHRRTQSEVLAAGHRRNNNFLRMKTYMQKALRWGGVPKDGKYQSSFNPEVLANQKRQWYQLHSKTKEKLIYEQPTSVFEHFIIAGIHPDTDLGSVAETTAKRKNWETDMKSSGMIDLKMIKSHGPPAPIFEPKILFRYPPGKRLSMRLKDLASFCFPGGVEVAGNATVYGVCLHVPELVKRQPGNFVGASLLSEISGARSQFLVSAPRCYCLTAPIRVVFLNSPAVYNFCCVTIATMEFPGQNSKTFSHKKVNVMLDEMNFLLWKQQVLLTVRSHRLERLLTGAVSTPPETIVDDNGVAQINEEYEEFVAQDSAFALWLLSTISAPLLPQFVGAESASAVWNTVLQFFSARSTTAVMSLHYKLQSLKKGGDTMRVYLTRVKEVCDALESCGSPVPPVERIATGFDEQIEVIPMSTHIAQGEERGVSFPNNCADSRSSYSTNSRGAGRGRGKSRFQCQLCGKVGHLVDRCWHRFDKDFSCVTSENRMVYSGDSSSSSANTCNCCGKGRPNSSGVAQANVINHAHGSYRWVVDSGATHHVTTEASNILESSEFSGPGKLIVGNGMPLNVNLVGRSSVSSASRVLLLNDLLHVPQITKNLLLVSKLTKDNDVYLEFHANRCCIRDEKTGCLLLQGEESGGLYSFAINNDAPAACMAEVHATYVKDSVDELWHRRLGHPAAPILASLSNDLGFKLKFDVNKACTACYMGKSHKLPFNESNTVFSTPFELVFTDLWGPPHIASNGFRYYVSFVDAFTRHTWLYLLKSKDEAVVAFNLFQKLVDRQFGYSIMAVQSDWGGEFRSLSPLLAKQGIVHRLSCPHLRAKWCSRTKAPLPTKVLQGMSPFEKLMHKKPDYRMMRVFGCQCFPNLRPFLNHKLAFRSIACADTNTDAHILNAPSTLSPSLSIVADSKQPLFQATHHQVSQSISNDARNDVEISNNAGNGNEVLMPLESSSSAGSPSAHQHENSSSTQPTNDDSDPLSNQDDVINAELDLAPEETAPASNDEPCAPQRIHHMMTRSRCGVFKPKAYAATYDDYVPNSIHEAFQMEHWKQAACDEYDALLRNNTWILTTLPDDRSVVGCKWLFKVKHNPDGSVQRYKARLVAKGFSQIPGYDFKETFSPVIRFSTFNAILAVAVNNGWTLRHVDINNAFLNGDLLEEVYMQQPPGFEKVNEHGKPFVCKLQKALYGLRQAPRNWHDKLKQNLVQMDFMVSLADPSLFHKRSPQGFIYVLVYVDDIIITGSSLTDVEEVVAILKDRFSLKDLGELRYFLGIEVKRSGQNVVLSQKKFVKELLEKTGMVNATGCSTPMVISSKLSRDEGVLITNATEYRSIVGSLLYVCHTRPDISFSVGQVAQFMNSPRDLHLTAVKRILRYLVATLDFGLVFSPSCAASLDVVAFADANWGSNIDDRRSISGFGVFLGPCLITWSSKKQKTVSRSTMEAEYKSVADATADVTWLTALLDDLGVKQKCTPIVWCDNTSTVAMSANPVYHAQSKHVELDIHFVREKVTAGQLCVNYVPAMHQAADGFTKPLSKATFEEFRAKMCVQQSLTAPIRVVFLNSPAVYNIIAQERLNRITEVVSEMNPSLNDNALSFSKQDDQTNNNTIADNPDNKYVNDWMASAMPSNSTVILGDATANDEVSSASLKIGSPLSPESVTSSEALERVLYIDDNVSEASENRISASERINGNFENGQNSSDIGSVVSLRSCTSTQSLFSPARSLASEDNDEDDDLFWNNEKECGDDSILEWAKENKNDLLQIVFGYHALALPPRGSEIVFQPLEHLQAIEYERPPISALALDESYFYSFEAAGINAKLAAAEEALALSILDVLAGVLLEKQVVVVCPNLGVLSAVVLALIPIIRPFQWQSLLLPVLPVTMLDFLDAPVPFLVGVQDKPADLKMKTTSNLVQVNLPKKQVKTCYVPPLPQRKELVSELGPIHSRLSYEGSIAKKHVDENG
ncbi:hypothetical protein F3Y22_tig00111086pilonHSYRG00004 [Hibiscus syriacus]|uniref:Uncharacterized protein n=1 Tax=Hibiscus syriacus TaxID=106335 RepID=A0A6A2Z3V1_HIBSY|nr:hypothetical protein F3Y22_tig00111086pilonHSYRG00004 [Hibiscus syriacus]